MRVRERIADYVPALAAVVTFALVLRTFEFPSTTAWRPTGWATLAAAALALLATAGTVVVNLRGRQAERDRSLYAGCVQIAALVDQACSVPLADVGIHVWLVRRRLAGSVLERGPEFLLREHKRSGIPFVKGKGVVGRCWQEERDVDLNLERDVHPFAVDEASYGGLPDDARLGITWNEYQRTKHYQAIWATPLVTQAGRRTRVRGIVSVDITHGGSFDDLQHAMGTALVRSVLGACQDAL